MSSAPTRIAAPCSPAPSVRHRETVFHRAICSAVPLGRNLPIARHLRASSGHGISRAVMRLRESPPGCRTHRRSLRCVRASGSTSRLGPTIPRCAAHAGAVSFAVRQGTALYAEERRAVCGPELTGLAPLRSLLFPAPIDLSPLRQGTALAVPLRDRGKTRL